MYEIRCTLTGDNAEAESLDGALVAAATIVDDAFAARPVQGLVVRARGALLITQDGRYDAHATALARRGCRSVRAFERQELDALAARSRS